MCSAFRARLLLLDILSCSSCFCERRKVGKTEGVLALRQVHPWGTQRTEYAKPKEHTFLDEYLMRLSVSRQSCLVIGYSGLCRVYVSWPLE